jgi:hypothetical protein
VVIPHSGVWAGGYATEWGYKIMVVQQSGDINWWLCHTLGIKNGGFATQWGYKHKN